MANHDKKKLLWIFLFVLISLSSVSALQINDTIFFSTETNYTIFVDSITLDAVNVTATEIIFHNLTSAGSNFTNLNVSSTAVANFIGLDVGLIIHNINTSTDLFTSATGNQTFNASFTSGQVITINSTVTSVPSVCDSLTSTALNLTVGFFALAILLIGISAFFLVRREDLGVSRIIILIFVVVLLGVVFVQVIASQVISTCG